jgi:formamidopyrimidine-DNA glycosylase
MPELPDLEIYVERAAALLAGHAMVELHIDHPFLLRTAAPPPAAYAGRTLRTVARRGKRIVLGFDDTLYAVVHLMIAGRLRWVASGARMPGKAGLTLARFAFAHGTLVLTEAGTKRRASLHLVQGAQALAAFDAGGIDVRDCSSTEFARQLTLENHTLKRALTDPRLFAGIGNAYSDEILHRARLSPVALTKSLAVDEIDRLHAAARAVLAEWTARLRAQTGTAFPEQVTAFRPEMAAHGKFGAPCPVCGTPIQRIVYAENETNYCPRCQTGGRLLADRALSRLLHASWPKSIDELG